MEAHPAARKGTGTIDPNWFMLIHAYILIIHGEWSRVSDSPIDFCLFKSLHGTVSGQDR
jgi:hypothetical protein